MDPRAMVEAEYFWRDDNLATRAIGSETIIVPVRARACQLDAVFVLDEVASFVWAQIGRVERCTLATLVSDVTQEFAVDAETAEADVSAFVRELQGWGLVRSRRANEELPGDSA